MACELNRENVTISIIQYASDKLEDTGLFENIGGNKLKLLPPTPKDYGSEWLDIEDWELDEESDLYKSGQTANFDIYMDTGKIIFKFKDEGRESKQVEELDESVTVNLESDNFNRIHIGGISESNRGQGFGKEIYHSLIELGVLSTSLGSASQDAERVWRSIMNSGMYYWAEVGENSIAVSKKEDDIDRFVESKYRDGLEVKRGKPYISYIEEINAEFSGDTVATLDEDTNIVTIWPSDSLVDSYLPEEQIDQEHMDAIQEINELVGEEVLTVDGGDVIIEDVIPDPFNFQKKIPKTEVPRQSNAWVRGFLDRIGVRVQGVSDIVINGERMGADAVALPLQTLVMHTADGEVHLTEEAMHIATEIISQMNPSLYEEMMSEVESNSLYKKVFDQYSTDTQYTNEDGTPNEDKIKKEAIGKILAEEVLRKERGDKTVKGWWSKVVEFLQTLFGDSASSLSAFSRAVDVLFSEDIGNVRNSLLKNIEYLTDQGITPDMAQEIIDLAESDITDDQLRAAISQLIPPIVYKHKTTTEQDRSLDRITNAASKVSIDPSGEYLIDGKKAVDGNKASTQLNKSAEQRKVQEKIDNKRDSALFKDTIRTIGSFLTKDGFFDPASSSLPKNTFQQELWERLNAFVPGTVFKTNQVVPYKDRVYTVDLLAIEPDGRVSVIGFDEVNIKDPENERIPGYETRAYRSVIDGQIRAVKSTGILKLGTTRSYPINKVDEAGTITITIGDIKVSNKDLDYLMPIPSQHETTRNAALDSLVSALNGLSSVISGKPVNEATKMTRNREIGALARAVRHIQVKKDIRPLLYQNKLTRNKISGMIKYYESKIRHLDLSDPSNKKTIDDFSSEVALLLQVSDTYKELGKDYSVAALKDDELLSAKDRVLLSSRQMGDAQKRLLDVNEEFMSRLVEAQYGVTGLEQPEKVVGILSRNLRSLSQQTNAALQALYRLVSNSQAKSEVQIEQRIKEIKKLKDNYVKWMRSKGLDRRNMHKPLMKKNGHQLIDQTQQKFYEDLYSALERGDKKWVEDNTDTAEYKKFFEDLRKKTFTEFDNTTYSLDPDQDNETREELKERFLDTYDLDRGVSVFNKYLKDFPTKGWNTEEYNYMLEKGNEPLLAVYNAFRNRNEEAAKMGVLQRHTVRNFMPFVRKDWLEKTTFGGNVQLGTDLLTSMTINPEDLEYGKIDRQTGEVLKEIPFYYLYDISQKKSDGTRDYSGISTDLFHILNLYDTQLVRYKNLSEVESYSQLIGFVEKNKGSLATNVFGDRIEGGQNIQNLKNFQLYENFVAATVYQHRNIGGQLDMKLGKYSARAAKKFNKTVGVKWLPEDFDNNIIPLSKVVDTANKWFTTKVFGFNIPVTVSNFFGTNFTALIQAGKWFTSGQFAKSEWGIMAGKITGGKDIKRIALLDYFLPLMDSEGTNLKAKQLRMSAINSYTIPEAMMHLMTLSDRPVQWAIGDAFLQNTVLLDGELVNAREYLMDTKYADQIFSKTLSKEERDRKRKEYEQEVKELIDTKGIVNISEFKDGVITIPGVERTSDSVASLREKIQQISRNATGMGNQSDPRMINKTMIGRSAIMFKNWIPRLMEQRFSEFRYVPGTDTYEMGRVRALWQMLSLNPIKSIGRVTDILTMNDRGIDILTEKFLQTKEDWEYNNPGKAFNMTQPQFIEMYSRLIKQEMVELTAFASLLSLVLMILSGGDDDDYTDSVSQGFWQYSQRIMDKVVNELSFFYDPREWVSMANGSLFPALGVVNDFKNVFTHISKEGFGLILQDEEMRDSAKPLKYTMKALPVTRWLTPIAAIFLSEESAKDWGINQKGELGPIQPR